MKEEFNINLFKKENGKMVPIIITAIICVTLVTIQIVGKIDKNNKNKGDE